MESATAAAAPWGLGLGMHHLSRFLSRGGFLSPVPVATPAAFTDVPHIPPDNTALGRRHLLLLASLASMGQKQSEERPVPQVEMGCSEKACERTPSASQQTHIAEVE